MVRISTVMSLLPALLKGAVVTIELAAASTALAFLIAFIIGFGRLSRIRVIRFFAALYTEVFRGSSMLVQLFWMYFVLPLFGLNLPAMVVGILGVGLNFGAYAAEIVRTSLLAVPRGQTEAAIALNMTPYQRMFRIIVPQAFVMMLPPFGNLLVELVKCTSVVSLITISDLTFQGMVLQSSTFKTTAIFTMLLIIYFIISYPLTLAVRWFERRMVTGRV